MTYPEFCEHKRILCLLFDASETSGIRTKKRNTAAKGVKTSTHMLKYGFAADLVPDDLSKRLGLAKAARKLGLWAKVYGDHVHVHFRTRS